jgi:hypothetical protein
MKVPDFRKAFRDGSKFSTELFGEFHVTCELVGRLRITTGGVTACDPLVFPDTPGFSRRIPVGRHPVVVSIAQIDTDQRIACAMLRLGRRVPIRWEMAAWPGQDPGELGENEFFGYPVDSGTGCFMDVAAAELLNRRMEADSEYFNQLIRAMRETYVSTREWADFLLDRKSGLKVVLFSSGMGDGTYPSYWGFDRTGEVVCLVTDFDVLTRETMFTTVLPVEKP